MNFNLTKIIKEMDKTMITEQGGYFKLVVTYPAQGYLDERKVLGQSRQSFQRHLALYKHSSLASMGSSWYSDDRGLTDLLECVIGKGYDIEYPRPTTFTPTNSTISMTRC
jgi:hypothetical protein